MSPHHNRVEDEVTFGASIDTPDKSQNHLAPNVFDTPKSLTPVVTRESPSHVDAPLTPFYVAPSAQTSYKSLPKGSATASEMDLEAASGRKEGFVTTTAMNSSSQLDLASDLAPISAMTTGRQGSLDIRTKECKMWPSKQTLRQQAKAARHKRREGRACGCAQIRYTWSHMTKRQRLSLKIVIALFIIAIAVALGVGISKAVNGGVFSSKGQSHPISDPSS